MDGWCKENLAIFRDDSEYAYLDERGKGEHLSHSHILNHASGPRSLKRVEHFERRIGESEALQEIFLDRLEHMVAVGAKLKESCLWNAESVFHADFRQQAGAVLHQPAEQARPSKEARLPEAFTAASQLPRPALAEIQAVGVARSLGANVRGAVAEAPAIIASAKDMFPRPESMGEWILSRLSVFFRG